ncbi:MAG: B12-binding domain-containing radical SAM protein, partial [Ruminococcaceae bacterium]|nr:B12-binding domain-containing radical SAM protein [Oscillospiraceae bacterium]
MKKTISTPDINSDKMFETILKNVQKPGRYIGKEVNSVVKSKEELDLRFAFCFPDVYEVGMSHLGIKILYSILNKRDNIWCERVFMPWFDMLKEMRENKLPLFGIESRDPLNVFDIIGFTMQYEMSYTNILHMLNLSGIPIRSAKRRGLLPLVVAGGPAACNPEPMAEFIDIFLIGEGEESILELCNLVIKAKKENRSKAWLLNRAAKSEGFYVPSKYVIEYTEKGIIKGIKAKRGAQFPVKKRIIEDFNSSEYFISFPVPNIETIHDRTTVEVLRGCIRGCRFCQAGFIYRPFRTKQPVTLNA